MTPSVAGRRQPFSILLVEDDDGDAKAFQRAFRREMKGFSLADLGQSLLKR